MGKTLLVSIKPRFANLIFRGTKTVELRRTRPRIDKGDRIVFYVSSPTKALLGASRVGGLIQGGAESLWENIGFQSCLSRDEFLDYFEGKELGYGIQLEDAQEWITPCSLSEIRATLKGFHPPQIYRYLSDEQVDWLGITGMQRLTAA